MELYGFMIYLKEEKKTADNTCEAYGRDLRAFDAFLQSREVRGLAEASETDVAAYLMELKKAASQGQRPTESCRLLELFISI